MSKFDHVITSAHVWDGDKLKVIKVVIELDISKIKSVMATKAFRSVSKSYSVLNGGITCTYIPPSKEK